MKSRLTKTTLGLLNPSPAHGHGATLISPPSFTQNSPFSQLSSKAAFFRSFYPVQLSIHLHLSFKGYLPTRISVSYPIWWVTVLPGFFLSFSLFPPILLQAAALAPKPRMRFFQANCPQKSTNRSNVDSKHHITDSFSLRSQNVLQLAAKKERGACKALGLASSVIL